MFEHGPLFATVVNERDRELAPRKQISMGEQFYFGPIGLVNHGTAPHRLAIYDAPKGGRMLFQAAIEPLEPNDQLVVSLG